MPHHTQEPCNTLSENHFVFSKLKGNLFKMCHYSHAHVLGSYGGGGHCHGFARHHRFGGSRWGRHHQHGIHQADYEQTDIARTPPRAPVRAAAAANPPPQKYGVVRPRAPASDVTISDEPPPYTKSAMETSDVPASVRRLNANQSQDPVPLESLGKESAYVMCPKCHNESFTRTKTVPRNKAVYVPVAVICYGTGVLAPLACMYLNKYGDKIHCCGVCGSELAKWRSAEGVTLVKESN